MSTIPSYPFPARDLDGGEPVAAFQDGRQVQVPIASFAPVVGDLLKGELNPEASAYASWQMLPGNGGKSRADYIASLKGEQGDAGPTGSADNTYTSYAAMQASDPTRKSARLVGDTDTPAHPDGPYSNPTQTVGGWVAQPLDGIIGRVGTGPARPASASIAESISLESQYKTSNDQAQKAAQALALASGAPVNYQARTYSGGAAGTNARVEAHGRGNFNGNGATIEYSATGKTPIAGTGSGASCVPSVWVPDPSETVAAQYPTAIINIVAAYPGDTTITCTDTPTAIVPPCFARLIGAPSQFSSGGSPGNYIPKWSEIVRVLGKSGNVLTLAAPVKYTYNSTRCLCDCVGTPVGSVQRDFIIDGDPAVGDAYQMVGRDEIDCTRENILLLRDSAVGALTFAHNPTLRNCHASGAYGPFSLARGNTGTATYENLSWQPRAAGGEKTAMFIEESFEAIVMRKLRMYGAFSLRQVDLSGSPARPHVTLRDFLFDTSQWPDMSPFQVGSAFGVSWTIEGGTIRGPITDPSSYGSGTQYPGFTGTALAWFSGALAGDVVEMRDVSFEATSGDGTAPAIMLGGSFQGSLLLDRASCRFIGCTPPKDPAMTLISPFTADNAFAPPSYRVEGRTAKLFGAIDTNSAADGAIITSLPTGARPKTLKPLAVTAYGGTSEVVKIQISTGGSMVLMSRLGATTISLDGASFDLDI